MQSSVNKLLIVDGSNLLFQMFYGMPARITNAQGKAIHGTLGFVGALLKIVRMQKPTHIVVLFDGEHENVRSSLNAGYKANRVDYSQLAEEDTPFSQLSDIYAALDFLQIKHAETTVCETDDWVAGYALTCAQQSDAVISSWDSDFFQLITPKVSVLRYRGSNSVICTPEYIKEKLGILPSQYADFKALTGDASDNVRGADKIGPKTAAWLLCEFGSLEQILKNADNIPKPSVRKSIVENAERLQTNYKIIKLDASAGLPFAMNELAFDFTEITTTEVLKALGIK